jgi:hypothetical protein
MDTLTMNIFDIYNLSAHRMASGGSFASCISEAFFYADLKNAQLLVEAFAELFDRFMTQEERDELRALKAIEQANRLLKLLEV